MYLVWPSPCRRPSGRVARWQPCAVEAVRREGGGYVIGTAQGEARAAAPHNAEKDRPHRRPVTMQRLRPRDAGR